MNGTQISDTQRNNRTALTGHTIEALIVVVFYACRFIRGERSLGYFLVITALALIPVILGQFFFFKDRETGMIKHTVGIGFAITYSFMVLTTEEANIYVLVIPMILLVSVFNDVKFFRADQYRDGYLKPDHDDWWSFYRKVRLSGQR